jgi:hypothetical protein
VREGFLDCLRRGRRGGALGEVEGSVGPNGARGIAARHARHAHAGSRGLFDHEAWTVRRLRTKTSLLSLNSKLDLLSLQKFLKNLC